MSIFFERRSNFKALWVDIVMSDDRKLLELCDQKNVRGSGKGGQARNKTSNAVQLSLGGYRSSSANSRSREINLKHSLRKLKIMIALDIHFTSNLISHSSQTRDTLKAEQVYKELRLIGLSVNISNPNYPMLLGCLTDGLILTGAALKIISAETGLSVSALSKSIHSVPMLKKTFQIFYSGQHQSNEAEQTFADDV